MAGFLYRTNGGEVMSATTDDVQGRPDPTPRLAWLHVEQAEYDGIMANVQDDDRLIVRNGRVRIANAAQITRFAQARADDDIAHDREDRKRHARGDRLTVALIRAMHDEIEEVRVSAGLPNKPVGELITKVTDLIDSI